MFTQSTVTFPYLLLLDIKKPAIMQLSLLNTTTNNILSDLGGTPDGIVVDHDNQRIYWSNMGDDFDADDGSINVINFDGSGRKMLIGNGVIRTPKQLILEGRRLYWCDREGAMVCSCKVDGSDLQVHVKRPRTNDDKADILDQCVGIALDTDEQWLYWTQKGSPKGNQGRIFRVPLTMPAGASAEDREDIQLLLDKLPEPIDLLFDHNEYKLYWTDRGAEPNGNSINCADVEYDGLNHYRVICGGFKEAIGLDYDRENNLVYVSDLSGGVYQVTLENGKVTQVYQGSSYTGISLFSGG